MNKDEKGILIFDRNEAGHITFGRFTGATPSDTAKFAAGCILVGNGKMYSNTGTSDTPVFTRMTYSTVPSHFPVFAGTYKTLGGAAAEAITITGLLSTDVVQVVLRQKGASAKTILTALPTTNTLTVTFSGDPSTDHIIDYVIVRAVV